jgi:hypothetical protein
MTEPTQDPSTEIADAPENGTVETTRTSVEETHEVVEAPETAGEGSEGEIGP